MNLNQWKDESMVIVERSEPAGDPAAELEEVEHADSEKPSAAQTRPERWYEWLWRRLLGGFRDAFWKAFILLLALTIMTGCRAAFEWLVGKLP